MENTLQKSFSIEDDDLEDHTTLRRPSSHFERPRSGIEPTLHRFDSTCSLNFQNPGFLRQSIRDIKQLVQKKTFKEVFLPPNGARKRDSGVGEDWEREDEMSASNMSLNTPKRSFLSRLRRRNEGKKGRNAVVKDAQQVSRSQFDLRKDEWKDKAPTNSSSLQPRTLSSTTSSHSQEGVVKQTCNLPTDPSVLMPPPSSCHVPVAMPNNKHSYNRRNSCFEVVSNSSLDEASSSSISSSNYNSNQYNNSNSTFNIASQLNQPTSLKGFLKGKLMNSSLYRSQSDSQKKRMIPMKIISNIRSLSSDNFPVQKRSSDNISLSDSKASDSTSEAEVLHTLPEEAHHTMSSERHAIMVCEEEEDVEIHSIKLYSSLEEVVSQRNRLSIFLHFLLLQSDPVPLLFYLLSDAYRHASTKDQAKWAYELYSSFIHPSAPLRLANDLDTRNIDAIMLNKVEKEDLGGLFESFRGHAFRLCINLLALFRSKITMGLGSMYGEHHTDAASIRDLISLHLSDLSMKTDDQSALLCASVQAYMRSNGWQGNDKLASFAQKDKNKIALFSKNSKKVNMVTQEHQLSLHQFTNTHHCHLCALLIHGVSPQAYLCIRCDQAYHKECVKKMGVDEKCGSARKVDRAKTTAAIVIRKKNSKGNKGKPEDVVDGAILPRAVSMMSFREPPILKHFSRHKLLREDRVDQSDQVYNSNRLNQARSLQFDNHLATSQTSLATLQSTPDPADPNNFYMSPSYLSKSETELESEIPSLEELYGREVVKKMKPKEKKRQNVIIELIHTECTHVRNLKVMHNLIHLPIAANFPPTFTTLLFPNLPALISVHDELKQALKERQKSHQGQAIPSITDILVLHFTGDKHIRLMQECASFCEKQSEALDTLRSRQKKDPKLASLLQEAQGNPLCRRFELKDLLPTAMQRLTKYPLLISNIIKHTQDGAEVRELERALDGSRDLLGHVNSVVRHHHNHLKLVNIQRRLEKKSQDDHPVMNQYQNLDLQKHSLLYEGDMTWRINRDKHSEVHVLLLQDLLLLLLKQDDKLLLKCQTTYTTAGRQGIKTIHCPIIPLNNLLVKLSASDDKAFFLVCQLKEPQFYDLVAASSDDKHKWFSQIEKAVEAYKLDHPELQMPFKVYHHKTPSSPSTISLPHTSSSIPPPSVTRSSTIPSSHPSPFLTTHHSSTKLEALTNNDMVDGGKMEDSGTDTELKSHLIEKLQKIDGTIEELMKEKWGLIEELGGSGMNGEMMKKGKDRKMDGERDKEMDGEMGVGVKDGVKEGGLEDIEWLLEQVEWLLRQVQKDNDCDGREGDGEKRGEGGEKRSEEREIEEEQTFRAALEKDGTGGGGVGGVTREKQQLLMKALKIQKTMHSLTLHLQPSHHPTYHPTFHPSIQPIPTFYLSKHSPTPPPINPSTHPENHHDSPNTTQPSTTTQQPSTTTQQPSTTTQSSTSLTTQSSTSLTTQSSTSLTTQPSISLTTLPSISLTTLPDISDANFENSLNINNNNSNDHNLNYDEDNEKEDRDHLKMNSNCDNNTEFSNRIAFLLN